MSLISWNEDLSVGVPEMDAQHRKLIKLINNLDAAAKAGKGQKTVTNVMDEILAYATTHFRSEEQMLRRAGYAGLETHAKLHQVCGARAEKMAADVKGGRTAVTAELVNYLSDWFTDHIKESDKEYGLQLGPRNTPVV